MNAHVPVFSEGHAHFTAALGTTLHIIVSTDAVAAHLHMDGAGMHQPLMTVVNPGAVRSARINGRPVLAFGDALIAMPSASHVAAVEWLAVHGAYLRSEVDA